jgi:hypothetical protein
MTFVKYAAIAFVLQLVFLIVIVTFFGGPYQISPAVESFLGWFYLWPLLIIGPLGGGHGGELVLAPVAMFIHAVIAGLIANLFRKKRR